MSGATVHTASSNSERDHLSSLDVWGRGFINLLLRRLSERIAADGDQYLRLSGLTAPSRSTAVLYYLASHDGASVADLVDGVGYTHQGISKILSQLSDSRLVTSKPNHFDKRKRSLHLTELGKQEADLLDNVVKTAEIVMDDLFNTIGVDLQAALRDFETELIKKPLIDRLLQVDGNSKEKESAE